MLAPRLASLVLCAVVAAAAMPAPARAQGDWSVERDPFDKRVVARLKHSLARHPHDKRTLDRLAHLYERYRTLDKLIAEYERAFAKKATASNATILGALYLRKNDPARALTYYQRAAKLSPKDIATRLAIAGVFSRQGNRDGARQAFSEALAAATRPSEKKQVLRELCHITVAAGDIAAAQKHYAAYLALAPRDVQARIELGDALAAAGKYDGAIAAYRKAEPLLKSDPQRRVDVIARIGAALDGAGKLDDAVREYRRAMGMTRRGYYLREELTARIVDIYRRRQDLSTLIAALEKKWPPSRRGHFEHATLAKLYEQTGDPQRAVEAYKKAVRAAPLELDTQRKLIALLEASGRTDEAIKRYEKVVRIAPGEPSFQLELAKRYFARGKKKQALRLLARTERRFSGNPGVYAALAELYRRFGEKDRALAAQVHLTRIEPDDPSHLVNLGEQYWQRGEKNKALAIWKRIARANTTKGLARLGEVYAEHDMLTEALTTYEKAIHIAPKNADAYKGRAGVYERKRQWLKAVADWQRALDLIPDDKAKKPARRQARQRIVALLSRAGGHALAQHVAKWRLAFSATPPDLAAGKFLVDAYLRTHQGDRARDVLQRILSLAPDDQDAMHQLVDVYRDLHQYKKAIALLLSLADKSPHRKREYYTQIAELKTILNEDDEAIRYAQKALETDPKDPVAYEKLAERYAAMQKNDRAIAAYKKSIALDPSRFSAYFALARLYRASGALDDEAALYRDILRLATTDEILVRAGRQAILIEEIRGTLGQLERVVAPLAFTYSHKNIYRRILVELYSHYVPALVRAARDGDAKAATELSRLGDHGLAPLLEALADDEDPAQQRIAVATLGFLKNRGAARPLVKLAEREPTHPQSLGALGAGAWDIRVHALIAAGRLGDPRSIHDLIALSDHRAVAMREAAIFALGLTGDRHATATLIDSLGDRRSTVATLACLGLAETGDSHAAKALLAVVTDRARADSTRAACAFALGVIGDGRAVMPLAEVLSRGNDDTQRLAAWALGQIGDRRAWPALIAALFDKQPRVAEAVAWAVMRTGTDHPPPAATIPRHRLMRYPMDSGHFDEQAAVADLAVIPPLTPQPEVIIAHAGDIATSIQSALARHRDIVLQVLGDLDGRAHALALGPLTRGMKKPPAAKRRHLDRALAEIGAAIAPQVATLCGHDDPVVRAAALSVIAKTGAPKARAAVLAGLSDPVVAVATRAMAAAENLAARDPGAALAVTSAVAEILASGDWQRRTLAATTLGDLGQAAAVAHLARAVKTDPQSFVRAAAASSLGRLGRLGGDAAISALLAATRDPVPEVRAQSALALRKLGTPRARSRLRELSTSDPDPSVRAAAQ
ncbi:MAG TPA: HEAT repeat domain-containing protein [Kofleriaceae bacterium]|nr:HEAT repeat domain-containing protein [Kofleriaceae bacterium]